MYAQGSGRFEAECPLPPYKGKGSNPLLHAHGTWLGIGVVGLIYMAPTDSQSPAPAYLPLASASTNKNARRRLSCLAVLCRRRAKSRTWAGVTPTGRKVREDHSFTGSESFQQNAVLKAFLFKLPLVFNSELFRFADFHYDA